MANLYDIPAINGASLATMLAGLPFEGPVGAVRMGLIGGQWKVNPTYQELDLATFDVVVAGRRNDAGGIDVLMIEGEAPDEAWKQIEEGAQAPTEEVVADGLEAAKRAIDEMVQSQLDFLSELGVEAKPFEPTPLYEPEVREAVQAFAHGRLPAALAKAKSDREENLDRLKDEVKDHLLQQWGQEKFDQLASQISPAFK